MVFPNNHMNTSEKTQPSMTHQGRYPTHRLYDDTGCTKEEEQHD